MRDIRIIERLNERSKTYMNKIITLIYKSNNNNFAVCLSLVPCHTHKLLFIIIILSACFTDIQNRRARKRTWAKYRYEFWERIHLSPLLSLYLLCIVHYFLVSFTLVGIIFFFAYSFAFFAFPLAVDMVCVRKVSMIMDNTKWKRGRDAWSHLAQHVTLMSHH